MTSTSPHQHRRALHRPTDRSRRPWSIEGDRIAWVGPAADAPAADAQVDVGGRAVLPGFVDSHSHLVFAGDRAPEFAARMAGEAVRRRRHPHHRRRHPRGHRRAAHRPRRPPGRGDAPPGHHHVRDQERLRAHRPRRGPQPGGGPAVHRGDHVPRRPRRPSRVRRRPGRLRRAGHRRHARRPRPRTRAGSTSFCETGAFDADQARGDPRRRSRPRACAGGCTPTSSGRVPACSWRPSSGSTAVDHCTYLDDADIDALRDSGTIATLLPGVEFSTRQPYPDARAPARRRRRRRDRLRLQPRARASPARCRSASRWRSARWG